MADFIKYTTLCGGVDALCGEPSAQSGEFIYIVMPVQCGESFMQAGEPFALAGNYELAENEAALAVTDVPDSIAGTASAIIGTALAVTDDIDTMAATANAEITAVLDVTDTPDEMTGTATTSREAALSVTENRDGVNLQVKVQSVPVPNKRSWVADNYSRRYSMPEINAELETTEARDGIAIEAETVPLSVIKMTARENSDGLKIAAEYIEDFYDENEALAVIMTLLEAA